VSRPGPTLVVVVPGVVQMSFKHAGHDHGNDLARERQKRGHRLGPVVAVTVTISRSVRLLLWSPGAAVMGRACRANCTE
jgi:hypothetical protein